MIGSRRKIKLIFEDLIAKGVAPEVLARVHAPLGLDIGSQTVPEIAVSIVAELIACRNLGSVGAAAARAGRAGDAWRHDPTRVSPPPARACRMGRPKLSLPLGERTVLERVLDALRAAGVEHIARRRRPARAGAGASGDDRGSRGLSACRGNAGHAGHGRARAGWIAGRFQPGRRRRLAARAGRPPDARRRGHSPAGCGTRPAPGEVDLRADVRRSARPSDPDRLEARRRHSDAPAGAGFEHLPARQQEETLEVPVTAGRGVRSGYAGGLRTAAKALRGRGMGNAL